jgi:hypothetical protein
MVANNIGISACEQQFFSRTSTAVGPIERRNLSLQVLAKTDPVTLLAQSHGVSRKFLYQQAAKAQQALDKAFDPMRPDKEVLYYLPITKEWIRQLALCLVLVGHSPFRAVCEILDIAFDYQDISIGTVHNIVADAVIKARAINKNESLSAVKIGGHDEIYQASRPVLVGMDVESTYCYLLAAAEHCDETTWGVYLLELSKQGLCPDYTIADGGQALRAGQRAAWGPEIPCHGDIFHAESTLNELASYLERRAGACAGFLLRMELKMEKLKNSPYNASCLGRKLALARKAHSQAAALASDVRILVNWMHDDILSLSGPDLKERKQLYDFILEELNNRKSLCPHRIEPVYKMLKNHRDNLLAFASVLDDKFAQIAEQLDVPAFLVHAVCQLEGLDVNAAVYWQRRGTLQSKLKDKFNPVELSVREAMSSTPRASSIVENLNSRLRNYFFLRRHIGDDYLELLRFFINHHRFERSERVERVGKSPAELLTGNSHPHWLDMLGFKRFSRN